MKLVNKIIFIEFSMLLESYRTQLRDVTYHSWNHMGEELEDESTKIDMLALLALNDVVKDTNANIVIMGTKIGDLSITTNILRRQGLPDSINIIGVTPNLNGLFVGMVRGNDVAAWLAMHEDLTGESAKSYSNYVILTENPDNLLWSQRNNYIHVNNSLGFFEAYTPRIIYMLNSIKIDSKKLDQLRSVEEEVIEDLEFYNAVFPSDSAHRIFLEERIERLR